MPKTLNNSVEEIMQSNLSTSGNELSIGVFVKRLDFTRVEVTRIKCEVLPFLENESMLLHVCGDSERAVEDKVREVVWNFFAEYGLSVDVRVSVSDDGEELARKEYSKRINLVTINQIIQPIGDPVRSPDFRTLASVTFQESAFASGVLQDINAFHRYTLHSDSLSRTPAM